jgi:protein phosphatase
MSQTQEIAPISALKRKPRDEELDFFGMTDRGKVRAENQDHFIMGSLRKRINIRQSSLPLDQIPLGEERVASFMMVADGVGGGLKGEQASRMTLEVTTKYLAESARCYYRFDEEGVDLVQALEEGALKCSHAIQERAAQDESATGMATTLTLFIGAWPWAYLLQVGDSRYYQYHDGELTQMSRDQTVAQELADQGIMPRDLMAHSPLTHVLSSSIGGRQTAPVVTRIPLAWGTIHLLCSDGLTRHVPDEKIAERLAGMKSAQQVAEQLIQDALDGGGSDNVTVVVGRAVPKD